MQISTRDLSLTLILTLAYLLLVLGLTPVFTNALPGDLVLYSFIPSTLLATGLIYVLALYLRGRFRVGAQPRTHIEKEVAQAGQRPGYTYRPAPIAQTYSAPPPAQVQTPQQVRPATAPPAQTLASVRFCIYCGKPMDARLQTCPNCNRGQW